MLLPLPRPDPGPVHALLPGTPPCLPGRCSPPFHAFLIFTSSCVLQAAQSAFMRQLWDDSLAFGGAVIIRRLASLPRLAALPAPPLFCLACMRCMLLPPLGVRTPLQAHV